MTSLPPPVPRFDPLGDSAVTITLGYEIDLALTRRIHALGRHVRLAGLPSVRDVVPGYAALTVFFDPLHTDYETIADQLRSITSAHSEDVPFDEGALHEMIAEYEGPDLHDVARACRLSTDAVIELHCAPVYTVFLIGFVPGFGYLGPLDEKLVLPRRPSPRRTVPAGSVAIAGRQTGVYPLDTPGGWHIIGLTRATLFDASREHPALLAPGDRVRFVPG